MVVGVVVRASILWCFTKTCSFRHLGDSRRLDGPDGARTPSHRRRHQGLQGQVGESKREVTSRRLTEYPPLNTCDYSFPPRRCRQKEHETESLRGDHVHWLLVSQTIFEINSHSRTEACVVMRRKRCRDAKLVEKFSRKREDLATEDRLLHPAPAASAAAGTVEIRGDGDSEEDEELLQVGTSSSPAWEVRSFGLLCNGSDGSAPSPPPGCVLGGGGRETTAPGAGRRRRGQAEGEEEQGGRQGRRVLRAVPTQGLRL